MIQTVLDELRLDCRLARFNRCFSEGVDYGIVVHHDSELVVIKKYDRDGLYDGLKMFWLDDIETIHWNGNDLAARTRFLSNMGLNLDPIQIDITSFDTFLQTASAGYGYVTINNDRDNEIAIGPVLQIDNGFIKMVNLGNPSRLDRTHLLRAKSTVHSLEVDGVYERNLAEIHGIKPSFPGTET